MKSSVINTVVAEKQVLVLCVGRMHSNRHCWFQLPLHSLHLWTSLTPCQGAKLSRCSRGLIVLCTDGAECGSLGLSQH